MEHKTIVERCPRFLQVESPFCKANKVGDGKRHLFICKRKEDIPLLGMQDGIEAVTQFVHVHSYSSSSCASNSQI